MESRYIKCCGCNSAERRCCTSDTCTGGGGWRTIAGCTLLTLFTLSFALGIHGCDLAASGSGQSESTLAAGNSTATCGVTANWQSEVALAAMTVELPLWIVYVLLLRAVTCKCLSAPPLARQARGPPPRGRGNGNDDCCIRGPQADAACLCWCIGLPVLALVALAPLALLAFGVPVNAVVYIKFLWTAAWVLGSLGTIQFWVHHNPRPNGQENAPPHRHPQPYIAPVAGEPPDGRQVEGNLAAALGNQNLADMA